MTNATSMPRNSWESLIPPARGRLPNGSPVPRTDPGGTFDAPIAVLGLYPAARVIAQRVAGRLMNLPVAVERTSFESGVSKSAMDLDVRYLGPLALERSDVLLLDLMPYFLANTRKGENGRTMADNLRDCERLTGENLGIEVRPTSDDVVRLARSMPGNLDRLAWYIRRSSARLLLTLGAESAAFVREVEFGAIKPKAMFYRGSELLTLFGKPIEVVHLAHPGILMTKQGEKAGWPALHDAWCREAGRQLVGDLRRG